jgi:hypothetical protein
VCTDHKSEPHQSDRQDERATTGRPTPTDPPGVSHVACRANAQVSLRGLDAIEQIPAELKAEVDSYLYTPAKVGADPPELLQVKR